MNKFIRKISSRKLWIAVAGIAIGVAMLFGVRESDITTVAGTVLAMVSAASYIVTEGEIDAISVKNAIEGAEVAINVVKGGECSGS